MTATHSLSELTDDFVAYRRLEPFDPRVPGVLEAWQAMGLPEPTIVRKRDLYYPQAAGWILKRFHALHAPGTVASEMLLIGDTLGNDGGAYRRLADTMVWRGSAFIGSEALNDEPQSEWQEDIYVANRWQALQQWLAALQERKMLLDDHTIVVVDIDKTALGARGRNHLPIDATRLTALQETVNGALGPDTDQVTFSNTYHTLNQPVFHDLTGDNQDYLAYVSIMIGAGMVSMDEVQAKHSHGQLNDFGSFIDMMAGMQDLMSPGLADMHAAVYETYIAKDPTPFKDFRRNEYLATIAHMGNLVDGVPLTQRLADEICLTQEVWDACQWLRQARRHHHGTFGQA